MEINGIEYTYTDEKEQEENKSKEGRDIPEGKAKVVYRVSVFGRYLEVLFLGLNSSSSPAENWNKVKGPQQIVLSKRSKFPGMTCCSKSYNRKIIF